MTQLSQIILDSYQVRKSKKQKTAFINLLSQHMPVQVQSGGVLKNRNIVVGDLNTAKVVFTAHYDTCAVMPVPNFITPKNMLFTILYSFLIALPVFIIMAVVNAVIALITADFLVHYLAGVAVCIAFIYLLMAGPANKHTANDNTSGVITLCEIYAKLTDEQKQKVALVFFDNEEIGLVGSSLFKKMNKKVMADKLLVNFDCVSDGDNILMAVSKGAQSGYNDKVKQAFTATENKKVMVEKGEKVFYPSDQINFKYNVAVAALKHKKIIGYYMDRIHTPKDTVFDTKNIELLSQGAVKLTDML